MFTSTELKSCWVSEHATPRYRASHSRLHTKRAAFVQSQIISVTGNIFTAILAISASYAGIRIDTLIVDRYRHSVYQTRPPAGVGICSTLSSLRQGTGFACMSSYKKRLRYYTIYVSEQKERPRCLIGSSASLLPSSHRTHFSHCEKNPSSRN